MSSVRIGIVGIGGMGGHHANYLNKGEVQGATLAAVCDASAERLKGAKDKYGDKVQYFESSAAMYAAKAVDAVLVATPHPFHCANVIEAFQNGVHALTEKPAGVYTLQVKEMNEAAAKSGKIFAIMFNQRTVEQHKKMKDLVANELGEVKRTQYMITDWFRSQSYYDSGGWRATWGGEGGGVLMNQAPHNLDLWQWICGMPTRVRAFCNFGKYHNIEVEDDVTAYVEYKNGATGTFITTTGEAPGSNTLEVSGENGRLVLEGGKITFWRNRIPTSKQIKESKNGFQAPECWKIDVPAGGHVEQHRTITQGYVNAILKGEPLMAKGEEGINSLMLANAMLMSTWTDSWVNLPLDDEKYYQLLQEKIKNSKFKKPGAK